MPVEVVVSSVAATPREVLDGDRYAAETQCPACRALSRYADVSAARARKGCVAALHDRCECRLLPRFYERQQPTNVDLWTVDGNGRSHRLVWMNNQLLTPQWVPFVDPVDCVRVVATKEGGFEDAKAFAHRLRTRGYAVRVGVGSPDNVGDLLPRIIKKRKPKAKKKVTV